MKERDYKVEIPAREVGRGGGRIETSVAIAAQA